ncbi:unnamed protein product, partial [Strongylus vulgaris]
YLPDLVHSSDPTPQAIEGKSVPQCRYDVLSSVNGPTLRFANVGEPVVHNCVIEKQLVPDVKYESDLSSAYTTISAFRFAEQIVVHFSCQITLCRKHEQGCEGIAPPVCVPIEFPPIHAEYRHSTRPSIEATKITELPKPIPTPKQYGFESVELNTRTTARPTTSTLSNKLEAIANFHGPFVSHPPVPLSRTEEEEQEANAISSGDTPEFGIEIAKGPASPYHMLPEVPNDYRTETLSSVYDV